MGNKKNFIAGLLGNPTFNLGLGLLAASGPRPGPRRSFGQVLAEGAQFANQQQRQFQELQANRQALQQNQRQQQAISQLGKIQQRGLLSPMAGAQALLGNVPQSIARPGLMQNAASQMATAQNNHISGLLAQANPQAFTQAAIAQQFAPQQQQRPTSQMANFQFLNSLPPGQREQFEAMLNPENPSQQLADTLAAQQIQANLRDQENRQLQVEQQGRRKATGAKNTISEISGLIDLMEAAEGTAAQPGYWASIVGTGASMKAGFTNLLGGVDQDAEKIAETVQKMTKGFNRLSSSTIPDAFLGSDSKLDFFSNQIPSVDLQFGANLSILESYLQGIIDEDYVDDGEFNSSSEAQNLLQRIQSIRTGGAGASNGGDMAEAQRQAAEQGITVNGGV